MNAEQVEMEMSKLVEKYGLEGIVMIVGSETIEIGLHCDTLRFHSALPILTKVMLEAADKVAFGDGDA